MFTDTEDPVVQKLILKALEAHTPTFGKYQDSMTLSIPSEPSESSESPVPSEFTNISVGCAVITATNDIFVGANVENASYGASICAERTAISACVLAGARSINVVAIASDQAEPISPCGICRQFIREFGLKVEVLMISADGQKVVHRTLEDLLPMSFGPGNLGKPSED